MNIQQVNFNPLFRWINQCIGINADFQMSFEGKRPTIVNVDNLWNDSGIFQSVIKEVTVDFFNFEFNEETGELWTSIYLNYESRSGGSNGMQIGTCWYKPYAGWTFESSKERFNKYNNVH